MRRRRHAAGRGPSSTPTVSNEAKIQNAQQAEQIANDLKARLRNKLQTHEYAGVPDAFTVPVGSSDVHLGEEGQGVEQCSVEDLRTGPDAQTPDPDVLVSPDGAVALDVSAFQGSSSAKCLSAAKDALGW